MEAVLFYILASLVHLLCAAGKHPVALISSIRDHLNAQVPDLNHIAHRSYLQVDGISVARPGAFALATGPPD